MQDESTRKGCCRCGEAKPRADYYASRHKGSNRDGLQSYCKACSKLGSDEWRQKNLERSNAWQRSHRSKNLARYRGYESARYLRSPAVQLTMAARSVPCVDCGVELPPQVMELDHVRGEKSFGLGGPRLRDRPADEVAAEIAKCDVRCPNCHRMRHYLEREQRKVE